MDDPVEELRQVYAALETRDLLDEMRNRGLRADGVRAIWLGLCSRGLMHGEGRNRGRLCADGVRACMQFGWGCVGFSRGLMDGEGDAISLFRSVTPNSS